MAHLRVIQFSKLLFAYIIGHILHSVCRRLSPSTNCLKLNCFHNNKAQKLIASHLKIRSKMPTVRNARSLVTSRELQIWGKDQLNALFSVATMNADTDSASAESVKVIQGRVAHGTLYVRLTCPTMDNRHNKPRSSSRILTVRNFKFNLSTF